MPNPQSDEAKIEWYIKTLYLADVAGVLESDKNLKMTHLAEQYGLPTGWMEAIEEDLGLDRKFFQGILKECRTRFSVRDSICLVLRGLGCPSPEMRVQDVLGPEGGTTGKKKAVKKR